MKNLFAYLVCTGVSAEKEILEELLSFNPEQQKRGGLGYGIHSTIKVFTEFSGVVSRNVNVRINQKSPLRVSWTSSVKEYDIYEGEEIIAKLKPFEIAEWAREKLSNGRFLCEILQQHTGSNLVGVIGSNRCPLFDKGNACKFCEMKGGLYNFEKNTEEIIEALSIISTYRKNYVLTFSSSFLDEQKFVEICFSLKKVKKLFPFFPLAFESQPVTENLIRVLKDSGVDTWMVPLDCYSSKAQEEYTPGKKETLQNLYWDALPVAVSQFGEGNVIGNIIIGLEDDLYTREAIDRMIDIGVVPDILPIRPPEGFKKETDPKKFTEIQNYLKEKMHESGLASRMSKVKSGCAACGGCGAGISANTYKK